MAPSNDIFELRVELLHFEPPIWRQIALRSDTTLAELHYVIQAVMNWQNAHLHSFTRPDGTVYEPVDPFLELDGEDEGKARVRDVFPRKGSVLTYLYDFGDDWEHSVKLEGRSKADPALTYPRCLAGELAGPPDDSGGVWGYADMLEILANPSDEEYEEMREWIGGDWDPLHFDADEANTRLAETGLVR